MTADRPATLLEAERLRRGLLNDAEAAVIRARIEAFGDPAAGLPDDATVFAEDPPERFLREVEARRREAAFRARRRGWGVVIPVLAAALALLVLVPWPGGIPDDDIVLKGEDTPVLHVFRATAGEAERLRDGDVVRPGDVLQFAFQARTYPHGVLFSVDGAGATTLHHTFSGEAPPAGEVVVDRAFRLDDAPAFEAIHLVVARSPLRARALMREAAEARPPGAPPAAPPDGAVVSLTVEKGP